MSAKKPLINKDRFKNLSKITENIQEKAVSRFELELNDENTRIVDVDKLQDAPSKWNFYSKLPDEKFLELVESIEENSLLHPIVVWEKEQSYIILSGHNRVRAYKKLYEITGEEKYLKIPANVKKNIDEQEARQIIVDTNWIQRQLSTYERTQSILQKYVRIRKTRAKGQKTRDVIAQSLGITGRMVQNYISLNSLLVGFFDMIDDGSINIKQAVILSKLSDEVQKEILKNKENLNFDISILKKISTMSQTSDIIDTMTKKCEEEYVFVKCKIPKNRKTEFEKMYREFLEN